MPDFARAGREPAGEAAAEALDARARPTAGPPAGSGGGVAQTQASSGGAWPNRSGRPPPTLPAARAPPGTPRCRESPGIAPLPGRSWSATYRYSASRPGFTRSGHDHARPAVAAAEGPPRRAAARPRRRILPAGEGVRCASDFEPAVEVRKRVEAEDHDVVVLDPFNRRDDLAPPRSRGRCGTVRSSRPASRDSPCSRPGRTFCAMTTVAEGGAALVSALMVSLACGKLQAGPDVASTNVTHVPASHVKTEMRCRDGRHQAASGGSMTSTRPCPLIDRPRSFSALVRVPCHRSPRSARRGRDARRPRMRRA